MDGSMLRLVVKRVGAPMPVAYAIGLIGIMVAAGGRMLLNTKPIDLDALRAIIDGL